MIFRQNNPGTAIPGATCSILRWLLLGYLITVGPLVEDDGDRCVIPADPGTTHYCWGAICARPVDCVQMLCQDATERCRA